MIHYNSYGVLPSAQIKKDGYKKASSVSSSFRIGTQNDGTYTGQPATSGMISIAKVKGMEKHRKKVVKVLLKHVLLSCLVNAALEPWCFSS